MSNVVSHIGKLAPLRVFWVDLCVVEHGMTDVLRQLFAPNLVRVERLSSSRRVRRYLTLSLGLPVSFSIVFLQRHLGCLVNFLSFVGMLNAIWVHLAKFSFGSRGELDDFC